MTAWGGLRGGPSPFPSNVCKVFEGETLGLDFPGLGVWLDGVGFGPSFRYPYFSGVVLSSFLEWFADLPVVAEGVEDAAYAPVVFGIDGADDGGTGGYGAVGGRVGGFGGEEHGDGAAVEGLGAEVFVFGGFVADPEAVAVDGQVRDYGAGGVFEAEDLFGSEGGFVEVDGFGCVADGEEGGEGGGDGIVRHGRLAPVLRAYLIGQPKLGSICDCRCGSPVRSRFARMSHSCDEAA